MNGLTPYIIIGLNALLGLIAFFGGMIIRGLREDVKSLRIADEKLADKLSDFTHKDDFKEFRQEQREMFGELFKKIDSINDKVAGKVDRNERMGGQ